MLHALRHYQETLREQEHSPMTPYCWGVRGLPFPPCGPRVEATLVRSLEMELWRWCTERWKPGDTLPPTLWISAGEGGGR